MSSVVTVSNIKKLIIYQKLSNKQVNRLLNLSNNGYLASGFVKRLIYMKYADKLDDNNYQILLKSFTDFDSDILPQLISGNNKQKFIKYQSIINPYTMSNLVDICFISNIFGIIIIKLKELRSLLTDYKVIRMFNKSMKQYLYAYYYNRIIKRAEERDYNIIELIANQQFDLIEDIFLGITNERMG